MSEPVALAVDLGGTKVEAALVDSEGRILDGSRHRAPTGRDAPSEALADSVREVVRRSLASADRAVRVAGAGVASAGPVDARAGTASPINLAAWREYPLRDLVAEATGLDAVLRLDGLCIALAEAWLGALRDCRNGIAMVVSTGVGGGILADGRLIAGASGNAGHIGQTLVPAPAPGGARVTLEEAASGTHVVAWAREQGWAGRTGEDLVRAVADGDPVAATALARGADALGDAIASAAALLDLEVVAIGGGFANGAPSLLEDVRARFAGSVALDTARRVRIVRSALGTDGPLQGAAGLVHRADLLPD